MTSSALESTETLSPRRAAALLTPEQLAHYASKAWVAVPGFFSTAQTAQIASWVEELERRPQRPGVEMVYHEPKLDDPSVLRAALLESGFDAERFGELVQDAEVKARLLANTERSVERGTFGSPTFFVGDEIFFGKDRLRDVEKMILATR